ncbi:ABC-F family ATP-binding cassette domain-containing protein [Radiobacillus kanasensis]|uniref:ABC-F family ATP-binding cassette domain-containing protein n=1 Tax=Radiobacillus kanasensis TaxID=2844358 RepID=UPI001E490B57|nr:ABC-F family ATP-binding cassette domain-containing protein [Radiobacillus kanasensis]UFT99019.1 ABC-F family ATP-binding cassette domain-containing protein [Radiobacillus kanasensis]
MSLLSVEEVSKSYGDKILFQDISFTLEQKQRIGLIGVNGTGKSTLLKGIAGIESFDDGQLNHANDFRVEYLEQEPYLDDQLTVLDHIYYGDSAVMVALRNYEKVLIDLEAKPNNEVLQNKLIAAQEKMDKLQAWDANTQAKTILTKLGITEFHKRVAELSGGQRKRVAIAKALIQPADLLLLDEPTNHLDNETVEWLESYLPQYSGSIMLVTHERYFLNRITNYMFELENGKLYSYVGNYEMFLEKKAEREQQELQSEQKHANTMRRELAWLRRGAKARSTKQKARKQRIEEMKDQTFHTNKESLDVQVGASRLGTKVLEALDVSKSFEGHTIIQNFNHLFIPGDRIGIIGPNGSGKTTLLNMMAGNIEPDEGTFDVGQTVKIGYYTQNNVDVDENLRMIDYIKEVAEVIHTAKGDTITAEQMLERFLFPRSQQYTYIRRLSGGERRRLYLLRVLMNEPNVLFLDEPTNDLDTQTLGVLEDYLEQFPGVVITVSHDRYFLDRVVDQLIVFQRGEKTPHLYYGNYSEFLEDRKEQVKAKEEKKPAKPEEKPKKKKKLSYHEQKEWDGIEDRIEEMEQEIERLGEEIAAAGSDVGKVQELYEKQSKLEKQLEEAIERWEELSQLVEELKK